MAFDWSEYLKLAGELAGDPQHPVNDEAKLRSSVSRAYYAAFCRARNHLRDIEGQSIPPDSDVHTYVRDKFNDSFDSFHKKIGSNLNRLRLYRNKVDYDDSVPGLLQTVIVSLKQSETVISTLSKL